MCELNEGGSGEDGVDVCVGYGGLVGRENARGEVVCG